MGDVARRAGTSAAAVSRTMNKRPGVRPDVRASVLKAAEELGYRPHFAARNLALRRTGLVALILADQQVLVDSTLFSDLVPATVTTLEDDFSVVLSLPIDDAHRSALGDRIRPAQYDGAIVVGHRRDDPLVLQLAANELPTVTLGRPLGSVTASYVDVDNVEGGRLAGAHLASAGRQHSALLAGPFNTSWALDRADGFRAGLEEHQCGLPSDRIAMVDLTTGDSYEQTIQLLDAQPDLDGLLVASESFLPGTLAALASRHRRIPDDVAIVCFDDGPIQKHHDPPLTSVRQPVRDLGKALGEMLIDTVRNPTERRSLILKPELIRAGSSVR